MPSGDDVRKGFKLTKKNEKTIKAAETVAFDDLEEEICSPVAKRKREVSTAVQVESANISPKQILSVGKKARSRSPPKTVDSLSTVEKRLSSPQISSMQPEVDGETQPISAKSSSVKLKSTTSGVMKAYYPKIDYDISQSAAVEQALNSSSSHKKVLINLVQEICLNESAGLRNYGKDNTGRESIISSLQDILSCLPDEIASAVEDSATFSPELTTDEKEEILSLQRTLADLEGQYSQLGKFEANISDLGAKYNIWVDGAPDSGASARATASIQHEAMVVTEMAALYEEKLCELTTHCGKLIMLNQKLDAVKSEARIAQSALYDTAQTARAMGASSKPLSTDPKDLIRNFVAL